jgi:hypothetical protein
MQGEFGSREPARYYEYLAVIVQRLDKYSFGSSASVVVTPTCAYSG